MCIDSGIVSKKNIAIFSLISYLLKNQKQMKRKLIISLLLVLYTSVSSAQQKIIPLYNGAAPGSENWNWEEKTFFVKDTTTVLVRGSKFFVPPQNGNIVYNVTKPALTVFSPDSANGSAIIICTGGGLRVINIDNEGSRVATELNKKGITVFVLKHRLIRSMTDNPWQETLSKLGDTAKFRADNGIIVRQMANDDAMTAITYVRNHAAEFKIDPSRVGIIGFSGGGSLALSLSINEKSESRPNFSAFIYSVYRPNENTIPTNAPPAFIACATDDILAPSTNSTNLYNAWVASKNSVELHIYSKGGHGLRGSAESRNWITRFTEWLGAQGFLKMKQ